MDDDNITRAKALYEAFDKGHLAGVVAALSEDVEWTQPGTTELSGVHRGRDSVLAFFGAVASCGLKVVPLEFFGDGDRVVAITNVTFAGEQAHEVDRLVFRDGRVVAVEHIGDTEMLTRGLHRAQGAVDRSSQ